jgi:flagellar motor switch protein FliN
MSDISGPEEEEEMVDQLGDFGTTVNPAEFMPLIASAPNEGSSIDLLLDVMLKVNVELGRSTMSIKDILALGPGSVVELDRLAGEPVDVFLNGTLIARGEVVVVDEKFGVRVTEIVTPAKRISSMG